MELDLHGYNVEDATAAIMSFLFSFYSNLNEEEATVITGNGQGAMKTTFLDIMDDESDKYSYTATNNGGSYIIRKNKLI